MKIRTFARALAAPTLIAASLTSYAYGPEGHGAVGAIADKLVQGTNAATQINRILGGMSLEKVAVWADCIKGVSSKDDVTFVYLNDDSPASPYV